MKNETLLKKLQKLEKNGSMRLDPDFIALLNEVKQEVYNDAHNFTTDQKRASKKALAFLKVLQKKDRRPVLGYCDFQEYDGETRQVFTDSYMIFVLKTFYELPSMDDFRKLDPKNEKASYPDVVQIIPNMMDGEKIETDLSEYLRKLKAGMYANEETMKPDYFTLNNKKVWFDVKRLKTSIEILGTDQLDVYIFGEIKPIILHDPKTENFALILPIRKYE